MSSLPLDSSLILKKLKYDFYSFRKEAVEPETVNIKFKDLMPAIGGSEKGKFLSEEKLYLHQYEALKALKNSKNIILISGAGSGKTEAWFTYSFLEKIKTLVVYPTLALSNDQVLRLKNYSTALSFKVEAVDAVKTTELKKEHGRNLRSYLSNMDILITNPAFLLSDMKRWGTTRRKLLYGFIEKMKLIVLDEFDFYGPRELSLLISITKLLKQLFNNSFQVAILTATLGNPQELGEVLKEINGKDTAIIEGKPFQVENRSYVVLSKNMKEIFFSVKKLKGELVKKQDLLGRDVLEALEDFEKFKEEFFKVSTALKYLGYKIPSPYLDPSELLTEYVEDKGVTLVFSRSIKTAEEIYRKIRSSNPQISDKVSVHHHLVDKSKREEVEKKARKGEIKVLISPRTLAQGIDIGKIIRIVHLGLPETIREFKQREGRKGRRKDLSFTETIIFPFTSWDRELLLRGVSALREWTELKLEHAVINKENKYSLLFEALYKFQAPFLRKEITEKEINFLKELGLVREGKLTSKGKRTWRNLNFYEFSPPYGIKRVLVTDKGISYLPDIGYCDLIEKFQTGCLDYSTDGIVTNLRRKGKVVTGVEVTPLSYKVFFSTDTFSMPYEEYERIKYGWGEEPNIIKDYFSGRFHSEVICVVDPPSKGFGNYIKQPNRVYWKILSLVSRPFKSKNKTFFVRESKSLPVLAMTGGSYRDYTYGFTFELEPEENISWLRIGLALIMVVLRLKFGVKFETLKYELHNVGNRKIMNLHEPSSAGLLDKLEWGKVIKAVNDFQPSSLAEILLQQVDDQAHYEFIVNGANWELAKKWASKAVEYILAGKKIRLVISGKEIIVPKPSKALKTASFEALILPLDDNKEFIQAYMGVFNGEEIVSNLVMKEFWDVTGWEKVNKSLNEVVNSNFTLVVYNFDSLINSLREINLKTVIYALKGMEEEGRIVEIEKLAKEKLKVEVAHFEELVKAVEWSKEIELKNVRNELEKSRSLLSIKECGKWPYYTNYLREKAEKYVKENLLLLYKLHLALQKI